MSEQDRLARFEAMLSELKGEYAEAESQLSRMVDDGKQKTATFKQLMARKMTLKQFLDEFDKRGL